MESLEAKYFDVLGRIAYSRSLRVMKSTAFNDTADYIRALELQYYALQNIAGLAIRGQQAPYPKPQPTSEPDFKPTSTGRLSYRNINGHLTLCQERLDTRGFTAWIKVPTQGDGSGA